MEKFDWLDDKVGSKNPSVFPVPVGACMNIISSSISYFSINLFN